MTLTWENADWADGPRLCAWLDGRIRPWLYGPAVGRAYRRWAAGGKADFYTLDMLLSAAGWHPSEVDESVWCEGPRRIPPTRRPVRRGSRGKLSPENVADIRARARSESRKQLAAEFGVSSRTISNAVNGWTYANAGAA